MSKEEAWKDIEGAYLSLCQEMCGLKCNCDTKLAQIKEALNV